MIVMANRDVNITREWVKLFLGIALAVFGMVIILLSLLAVPLGAIDYSVVSVFGTIVTLIGALFGIDSNAKIKMHQQDLDFEIKSKELDDRMRRFERRFGGDEDDKYEED